MPPRNKPVNKPEQKQLHETKAQALRGGPNPKLDKGGARRLSGGGGKSK